MQRLWKHQHVHTTLHNISPAAAVKSKLKPLEIELRQLEKKLKKLELAQPQKRSQKLSMQSETGQSNPLELELKRLNKTLKKLDDSPKNVGVIVPSSEIIKAVSKPQESVDITHPSQLYLLEKELENLDKRLRKLEGTKGKKEQTLISPPQSEFVEAPSRPTEKTKLTPLNIFEKQLKRLEKEMKKLELEDNTKEVNDLVHTETNPPKTIKTPSEPQESILKAQPTPLKLMEKELTTLEKKLRKLTKSMNGVDMEKRRDNYNI